jgi:hypothetical protein
VPTEPRLCTGCGRSTGFGKARPRDLWAGFGAKFRACTLGAKKLGQHSPVKKVLGSRNGKQKVSPISGTGTEKRLRSNRHAKKFLRLNNVRGCRTLKAELPGFIDLKLRGFPLNIAGCG